MNRTLGVLLLILLAAGSVSAYEHTMTGDVLIKGTLYVQAGDIECAGDIEAVDALKGANSDISDIKQWMPYTFFCGSMDQGRAASDTVSTINDQILFTAPVDGEIAFVLMRCSDAGTSGDSLTVNIKIDGTSVYNTGQTLKLVPADGTNANTKSTVNGRGPAVVAAKDDIDAGEDVTFDLDTDGAYSPFPSGVMITVYFAPSH